MGRPPYVFHGDFFDNIEPCPRNRCPPSYYYRSGAPKIKGTFEGLKYIVENEGAHQLWRGLSPTLMMAVPATIIYFVGYESIRNQINSLSPTKNQSFAPLLAGASARAIAASIISPLELVRTNMQHLGPEGTGRNVIRQVTEACRKNGISVLFKGLVPTLWRDVPFSAIYWSTYEAARSRMKLALQRRFRFEGSGPAAEFSVSFMAGAFSGALAAAATTPFDVAKTRTQIQISSTGKNTKRPTMLSQLRQIWQTEGIAGLTCGLTPRVLKVAPACAIMIGSYEFCKAFFVQSKTPT